MTTEDRIAEHPDITAMVEHEQRQIAYYRFYMEYHEEHLRAILAIQELAERRSKATELPEPHEYSIGYRKSATGAMEPRTAHVRFVEGPDGRTHEVQKVTHGEYIAPAGDYRTYNPVGNTHRLNIATPKQDESRAFWPDIRIDPPYDR